MDVSFLKQNPLFRDMTEQEIKDVFQVLAPAVKCFPKNTVIHRAGDTLDSIGLVKKGRVRIENYDILGNKNIFDDVGEGGIFGETYACIPEKPLLVHVTAAEDAEVLYLNIETIVDSVSAGGFRHNQLAANLLRITAEKNFMLSRKIINTSAKSIRGRLISFLSEQEIKNESREFVIPFDRQALADYLQVDRSAMSAELSKMKKEGILDYKKNHFVILTEKIEEQ